jgi:ribosome-associated toxin RatA of RatAB toxin-antitoxin module
MPAAERTLRVDVTPPQLMALLTDFASYPDFLPDMREAVVLKASERQWEVRFSLQVIRTLTYTLRLHQPDPMTLQWSLVEGLFRSNVGSWSLVEVPGGTEATYQIDIQLGMFVPSSIVRSLVDTGLPETLERFRAEAVRRGTAQAGD